MKIAETQNTDRLNESIKCLKKYCINFRSNHGCSPDCKLYCFCGVDNCIADWKEIKE